MDTHRYSDPEVEAVYRAISERRDMRHFRPDPVDPELLTRLLQAAHRAPSVGYMQPWRFIRVRSHGLRRQLHALADAERERPADALCDGRERHVFGRRTLPEMDLASAACAIQNLWLAARAEGLGLGWVSLFDPDALARLLAMPAGATPIAILCLGHVEAFYDRPMLEHEGWAERAELERLVGVDGWPADAD